jgi:hypothetical protein
MKLKLFYNLAFNLGMAVLLGTIIAAFTGWSAPACSSVIFLIGLIPREPLAAGTTAVEALVTIFSSDIQKNLYAANEFYKGCKVDAGVASNAEKVQVPQSGARPGVNVNPTSFPLALTTRTDNVVEYNLDLAATDPIHLQDVNLMMLSYNKRMDVLQDHIDTLNDYVALKLMNVWCPTDANSILRTTGTGNTGILAPSATGTRKEITVDDIRRVAAIFDRQNVPSTGRRMLVDADSKLELVRCPEFQDYNKTGIVGQFQTGSIGKIYGFDVYERSTTQLFAANGVKKSIGAVAAATDNRGVLFFHPSFVRYAEGVVKVYSQLDVPTLLGSVFNAALRVGGTISRTDNKGVAVLAQVA